MSTQSPPSILSLCDATVSAVVSPQPIRDMILVQGCLVFPGETVTVTKPPIVLPDALQSLKKLFRYKMKRKAEESDDEASVHAASSSESEDDESEEETEEELASDEDA